MSVQSSSPCRSNADDFDFLHFLEDAALDTTGRDGAATFNVEHVFHRHEERLIDRAIRDRDVIIHRRDERENLLFLLGVAIQRLERAAFDDRNLVAGKFILREQIAHFHLDEIEKFRIIHHVDLVQEHDDRRARRPGGRAGCARASAASDRPRRRRRESRRPFARRP